MTDIFGLEPAEEPRQEWDITLESSELDNLREIYQNRISTDEFNTIITSASDLLVNCPNPNLRTGRRTGLSIGKVQSGKTLSFTALIGLAAANGYRLVIVLAGTKVPLMNQTHDRLIRDLGIQRDNSRIYIQRNPRLSQHLDSLNSALESGRCVLLVVLKNCRHLERLTELMQSLPRYPVLIIDDEGDEASLNTYFRHGEQSAIYRNIMTLRDSLTGPHAYIAYTATPQANLLLDAVDGLSPNFCELIEPGRGYCGAGIFFGQQADNYIRLTEDIDDEAAEAGRIPPSLHNALAFFFTSAVIRHMRSEFQKHSMLIHMSVRTEAHRRIYNSLIRLIQIWRNRLGLEPNDSARIQLISLFRQAYDDLGHTVPNLPGWADIESRLQRELRSCEFYMVNSLADGVRLSEHTFQLNNHIVVGGNILGRGLTIQNLAVSYMTRRARKTTNADTMEQRARWFGYKMEYLDLCRIYLPDRIRNDYDELLRHEDDFWDSLRRNITQGIPLAQWPRFFRLDTNLSLNPTRSSVARYRKFVPSGWDKQNVPIQNQEIVNLNISAINRFKQRQRGALATIGGTTHRFFRNVLLNEVLDLLGQINTSGTDWLSSYNMEYLERLHVQNLLLTMDVVLMSDGTFRDRTLEDNGSINNLMQGRNQNYPGDEHIHDNHPQLQIHLVQCQRPRGHNISQTTALALFMPDDPRFNLSYVVREESQ